MIKLFRKRKKKVERLEFVKEIQGVKFYTPKSIIEGASGVRYMNYLRLVEERETFKLNKDSRKVLIKEMKQAVNNNNVAAVSQFIGFMEVLDDLTYWDRELFEVANCFLLMEDEPLEEFSAEHTEIKRKMFDESQDIKVFFCQYAHEFLRHIAHLPKNTSVLDYLNQSRQALVNKMYSLLISSKIDKKSSTA